MNRWKNLLNLNCFAALIAAAMIVFVSGCGTTAKLPAGNLEKEHSIVLTEGDTIKVAFPSTPNLDTVAQIRRDGKITLPIIGEEEVVGMTAIELENKLKEKYKDQLTSDEVSVVIISSSFYVYVTGAVRSPTKVNSDRPLTALDAIFECGGPDYSSANLKGVIIDRKVNGKMVHYRIDLKKVLDGKSSETFYMRPGDILYVPQKFSWF